MTPIVGVHGIGNYHYLAEAGSAAAAADEISADWSRALSPEPPDGIASAPLPGQIGVAYYAPLLHRGTGQGAEDPAFLEDDAQDLLIAWVGQLMPATAAGIAQGPRTARARAVADWLTARYGTAARRAAVIFCREIGTYLGDPRRRQSVRDTVAGTIAENRARVIVAHSLGSVVAYETLWQHPELKVDLLLTLGSPLAMRGVVFDRLEPAPAGGRGARPPSVASWVNLADVGDIVAVPRTGLGPWFDGVDVDRPDIVIGEYTFHAVRHYLACDETAGALAPYLSPRSR